MNEAATDADVIVVGLGAMGSSAADALAGRGLAVVGLEAFGQGHANGSSHGPTRLLRRIVEEGPRYVPIVLDAIERWRELEDDTDTELVVRNGVLRLGPSDADLLQSFRAVGAECALPFEELTAAEATGRFGVRVPDGFVGLLEEGVGVIYADRTVATLQQRASRRGADLRFDEPVIDWRADGRGVTVSTAAATYRAERLVITAGPWTGRVVAGGGEWRGLPLVVNRIVNASFTPADPERFGVGRLPALIVVDGDSGEGTPALRGDSFYAVPAVPGDGFKVGTSGTPTDPDDVDRVVTEAEVEAVRRRLARVLPEAAGPVASTLTCLYTRTPDEDFVIDTHPEHDNVVVASPCSGHGFKYTPAIGPLLADLATGVTPRHDLTPFALTRFM